MWSVDMHEVDVAATAAVSFPATAMRSCPAATTSAKLPPQGINVA